MYSRMGSPIPVILSMFGFKSNTFESTSLNNFFTLTPACAEQKMSGLFIFSAYFLACVVMSSCSSCDNSTNLSYFVPMRKASAFLFSLRALMNHSFTECSVALRLRSNMKKRATLSLHTKSSMLIKSFCPPRSQIISEMSVFAILIDFSKKLTPGVVMYAW